MTHPQTTAPRAELRSLRDDVRAFLGRRFSGQAGLLCLGYIDGDPSIERMREEWYELPRQARQVTDRCVQLAEQGHNLYVAVCLFSARRRSYSTALPSQWLWIDDASIDGAELVETSHRNFQSWLELDQPVSAERRSRLQRAIRDAASGADTCSADAIHMARLPGGWNRKQHGAFRVRVARESAGVISVDVLSGRYPHALRTAPQTVAAGDWRDLPNGALLAGSPRFQRLIAANEQLRKVCAGEAIAIPTKNGHLDESTSAQRAIFVKQLLYAHYPHDEIRALALHFSGVLESNPKWFSTDIDRLLVRYSPEAYASEPTRENTSAVCPPRGGRPLTLTAGALLEWLHERADCGPLGLIADWTRNEIAEVLKVSLGTVQRREEELAAAGAIRRVVSPDRQRSMVVLLSIGGERRSEGITRRFDQTSDATPVCYQDVLSEPSSPDCDAANAPTDGQCEERAREHGAETTHPPTWAPRSRDELAMWEAYDPPIGAADLGCLNAPVAVQPAYAGGDAPAELPGGCVVSANAPATHERTADTESTLPASRVLLSLVRTLAAQANEPGWYLRDYEPWSGTQLQAEAERLRFLISQQGAPGSDLGCGNGGAIGATYDEARDWTVADVPARSRTWHAQLSPRSLERLQRHPDIGVTWSRDPGTAEGAGDVPTDAGDLAADEHFMPSPQPQREPARPDTPSALDRYVVDLARMPTKALMAERRKHHATLDKYHQARWLSTIRDKLALVQAEIDRRSGSGHPSVAVAVARPCPVEQFEQLGMFPHSSVFVTVSTVATE